MATSESGHNRVLKIPEARFGMVDMSCRPIIERMMKDKQRAQEIYDAKIKPLVEPQQKGKLLVLDITTEDYIVGRDVDSMKKELRCRCPDAIIHTIKIGHGVLFSLQSPKIVRPKERKP